MKYTVDWKTCHSTVIEAKSIEEAKAKAEKLEVGEAFVCYDDDGFLVFTENGEEL